MAQTGHSRLKLECLQSIFHVYREEEGALGYRRVLARIAVVVAVTASLLVPALVAPARTITVPVTLARTLHPAPGVPVTFAFAPTHVAFSWTGPEGTGVRFRTTDVLGGISAWQRAPENHDAERGDRHFSGVLAVDGVTAIEWDPVEPRGTDVDALTLDYLNTLDGPREQIVVPAVARAEATTPQIVTRAEWGADESIKRTKGDCRRGFFPVQQLFVHHTAGSNDDPRPKATMRAIYWYHVVRQGWCDIGYNFVISQDGTVFEGRWARKYQPWEIHSSEDLAGQAVAGAHAVGYNSGSVGVAVMGNFMRAPVPPDARRSLAELLAWEADRHDIDPLGEHLYQNPETGTEKKLPFIAGHRDAGQTSCPGSVLYRALPEVREDTAAVIGEGKNESHMTLVASSSEIRHGDEVSFTGRLTDSSGSMLGERTVGIYRRDAGSTWHLDAELTTQGDGTFTYPITPERNVTVRAVYDGDEMTWGAQSGDVRVRVTPVVTLAAEGEPTPLGFYSYPNGTETVDLLGSVAPPHAGFEVILRIEQRDPEDLTMFSLVQRKVLVLAADSSFTHTFEIPDTDAGGTFRAVAKMARHADHSAASSDPVIFVVEGTTFGDLELLLP